MEMTMNPKRGNIDQTRFHPAKEWNGLYHPATLDSPAQPGDLTLTPDFLFVWELLDIDE